MAQIDLQKFTSRGVAMKLEAQEGVPVIPDVATNGVLLLNGTSGTEFDEVQRAVDSPHFTGDDFGVANERAWIEGDFELYPPLKPGGATQSSCDNEVILLPAGMTVVKDAVAKRTRYNPITNGIPTATVHGWHSKIKKALRGTRNNITGLSLKIGARFQGKTRIQGAYAVSQEDIPQITVPDVTPTILTDENGKAYVTVGGGVDLLVWAKELSIDFGSSLKSKQYTSKRVNAIDARKGTFKLQIAETDLADFDPWKVRHDGAIFTARLRLLESNGLYSELGIRGKIKDVSEDDIDGDYGWTLSGPCLASSAGGDEFYIEFGDTNP